MAIKMKTLLIATIIALASNTANVLAQEKNDQIGHSTAQATAMFNPMTWMSMPGGTYMGTAPGATGNPFQPFMSPGNWINPNTYMAFMNPQSWGQMMNPATYMAFMNPAMYSQLMNPNAYMAYMNPATYANSMDPNSYMAGMMQMFNLVQGEETIPTDFWKFFGEQMQTPSDAENTNK